VWVQFSIDVRDNPEDERETTNRINEAVVAILDRLGKDYGFEATGVATVYYDGLATIEVSTKSIKPTKPAKSTKSTKSR